MEQKAIGQELRKLLLGISCSNLHHPTRYQHKYTKDCPVQKRIQELLDLLSNRV